MELAGAGTDWEAFLQSMGIWGTHLLSAPCPRHQAGYWELGVSRLCFSTQGEHRRALTIWGALVVIVPFGQALSDQMGHKQFWPSSPCPPLSLCSLQAVLKASAPRLNAFLESCSEGRFSAVPLEKMGALASSQKASSSAGNEGGSSFPWTPPRSASEVASPTAPLPRVKLLHPPAALSLPLWSSHGCTQRLFPPGFPSKS